MNTKVIGTGMTSQQTSSTNLFNNFEGRLSSNVREPSITLEELNLRVKKIRRSFLAEAPREVMGYVPETCTAVTVKLCAKRFLRSAKAQEIIGKGVSGERCLTESTVGELLHFFGKYWARLVGAPEEDFF